MTIITLSEAVERNNGLFQVFGTYQDDEDRFVSGVQDFGKLEDAERHARKMMEQHEADHFQRVK